MNRGRVGEERGGNAVCNIECAKVIPIPLITIDTVAFQPESINYLASMLWQLAPE
jgi:hypothetical protein